MWDFTHGVNQWDQQDQAALVVFIVIFVCDGISPAPTPPHFQSQNRGLAITH